MGKEVTPFLDIKAAVVCLCFIKIEIPTAYEIQPVIHFEYEKH